MTSIDYFITPFWTVSELTFYLSQLLEVDEQLQDLWVQGEISNLSRPASGHLYFTLKDKQCALRCVMWRSEAMRLTIQLQDGQLVDAHGRIKIYPAGGVYQLYVDQIQAIGEGQLFLEFLRLKNRLEAEGLFAAERKKPLPSWPNTIGVVTSASGAAIQDIIRTITRRFPLTTLILAPASVQGVEAPAELMRAIEELNYLGVDVIILARGGGSIEDLWAFNDEGLARAIARSTVPIITGIGHETDFTIADFVSDLRAPTPTGAAELATPNIEEIKATLIDYEQQLTKAAQQVLQRWHEPLRAMVEKMNFLSPMRTIHNNQQRIDELSYRLDGLLRTFLERKRSSLQNLEQTLMMLDPREVLRRGYAILQSKEGAWITRAIQTQPQEELTIHMFDGKIDAEVKELRIKDERQ